MMSLQFMGFLVSRVIDLKWPTISLMTFLLLFLSAFGFA
jgi:hypothetical protein